MLQNMYLINGYVNNKEESNYAMLLTSMSENVQSNKQNYTFLVSLDNIDNNQLFLKNMNIPYNLIYIQPISTQVRNCDEIGVYSNGNWNDFICSYKRFQVN